MDNLITREEAVNLVGLEAVEAVEAVEAENCEPTNRVGFQGVAGGDTETQWAASVDCADLEDGYSTKLTAYYYTSNDEDDAILHGEDINWVIGGYEVR